MHDQIKVLDIEEGNSMFRVRFEVPGKHYGQDYPKRLSHDFPINEKWFEKVDFEGSEIHRFEEYLIDNYIQDEEDKKEKNKCCKKINEVKSDIKGKSYGKNIK